MSFSPGQRKSLSVSEIRLRTSHTDYRRYAAVLVVFTSNNNGLSAGQGPQLSPKHSVG